jgi:hypothetical protein
VDVAVGGWGVVPVSGAGVLATLGFSPAAGVAGADGVSFAGALVVAVPFADAAPL